MEILPKKRRERHYRGLDSLKKNELLVDITHDCDVLFFIFSPFFWNDEWDYGDYTPKDESYHEKFGVWFTNDFHSLHKCNYYKTREIEILYLT